MPATFKQAEQRKRVEEAIQLLKLALEDCYRFLGELDEADRLTRQDNDPQGLAD